jgi:type I restriction enzyme S subunit
MIHAKPYPSYKDSCVSWLGAVPEHWDVRKLKYAASFSGGGTPSKANASFWNGHIPWVSPKDMQRAWITDATDHITDAAVRASATNIVSPGALLMVVRSGILVRTIPVAINAVGVALNQDMKALRPKPGLMPEYLRALVQGNEATLIAEWTKQGATVESIEHEFLANSRIPLPPLPEQAAIVRFLDHADLRIRRYIRAKLKLIKVLEEQKQTIAHRVVTRGLDPNVRLKPSGVEWLGSIPAAWSIHRTKNLFRLRTQKSGDSHGLELLSIYTHIGVRPRKDLEERGNKATTTDDYWIVMKGDIIVNKLLAWMGAVGVSSYDGVTSPAYDILMPIRKLVPDFYHHLFRTKLYLQQFKQRSRGIMDMRLRLYFDQLGQIPLVVPPLEEQSAIVEFYIDATADLDQTIGIAQREISLLREYRTRLIADVATGKLDVRAAAANLPAEMEESELPLASSELVEEPDVDLLEGNAELEE